MQVAQGWQIVLLIMTALGYGGATIGMKLASGSMSSLALGLIAVSFLAAGFAEVVLMRTASLGRLYLTVIALETIVVLVYSAVIGEGLTQRDMLGGLFLMVGLLVLQS